MIDFEKRVVAFIDLLGFRKMVEAAEGKTEAREELQKVVSLLGKAIPAFDSAVNSEVPPSAIPKHIYISDSIILSAPLEAIDETGKKYYGLRSIVMRCIQLCHLMLLKGYLLRGGIAIGNCWHSENNIIGTAYIEAFKLEQTTRWPRIQLSDEAYKHWKEIEPSNRMVIPYKGVPMVNGLHEGYIYGEYETLDDVYKNYESIITQKIENLDSEYKKKWICFQNYFQEERENLRLGTHPENKPHQK